MTTVMSEGKQVELNTADDSEGPNASAGHTIINVDRDVMEDALKDLEPEPDKETEETEEDSYEHLKGPKKVFFLPCGEVLGSDEQILQHLTKDTYLTKVESVEKCDLILAVCPIVSRVGADIVAFLEKCNEPGMLEKRLVLVVLHHTFDPDYTIPDINRHVTRNDVLTVNFLFHATQGGLLTCPQNNEALKKISSELDYEADHRFLKGLQNIISQIMSYIWLGTMGAMSAVSQFVGHHLNSLQPANKDEASQPVKKDEASQPVKKDEASQLVNKDEASQPVNKDEASQLVNKDEASQPVNKDEEILIEIETI